MFCGWSYKTDLVFFRPPPPRKSGSCYLVFSVGGLHSWDPLPIERDTLRFPNHRAPYHQFTICWEKVVQRTHEAEWHISISPRFTGVDRPSDTKPSTHVTSWCDEKPTVTFIFPPKQAWKHQHQSMVLLLGFELLLMVQKSHSQPLGMVLKPCK